MNRQLPPLTGSNLSRVVVSPRGPSHWAKRSGSVCALKTSSRGASNSRVTKSSCFPCSAVIIVLFFDMGYSFHLTLVETASYPPPPGYTQPPVRVFPSWLNVPL